MSDALHGLASARRVEHTREALGRELLAGAEVSTEAFRRSQRLALGVRIAVFCTGFAVAFVSGLGWVLLSIGAVVHHLMYRTRQAMVATENQLHLVTSSSRTTRVTHGWPGHVGATLRMTPGEPDIVVTVDDWEGRVSGLDLDPVESTIRAAGGEPLRIVDRS